MGLRYEFWGLAFFACLLVMGAFYAQHITGNVVVPDGTIRTYEYKGEEQVYDLTNGVSLHADKTYSSQFQVSSTGQLSGVRRTDPFGKTIEQSGTNQEKTFAGYYPSEQTGLLLSKARAYDTTTGRFVQIDPVVDSTISPYSYSNNNPVKYFDPYGRSFLVARGEDQTVKVKNVFEQAIGTPVTVENRGGREYIKLPDNYDGQYPRTYAMFREVESGSDVQIGFSSLHTLNVMRIDEGYKGSTFESVELTTDGGTALKALSVACKSGDCGKYVVRATESGLNEVWLDDSSDGKEVEGGYKLQGAGVLAHELGHTWANQNNLVDNEPSLSESGRHLKDGDFSSDIGFGVMFENIYREERGQDPRTSYKEPPSWQMARDIADRGWR
ncbi:MAG: RHS repeat-associated core domain-containing protein [Candidatus Woesearchaeota archaeon]